MINLRTLGALAAILAFVEIAVAQSPTPRQPIGPTPNVNEMLPPPYNPISPPSPVTQDRIRIVNIGDQKLFISYWDAEFGWKVVSISAGGSTEVVCPKCAGTITVAYHNGKENKSVKVKAGGAYILGWSAQAGAWVLTSSAAQ